MKPTLQPKDLRRPPSSFKSGFRNFKILGDKKQVSVIPLQICHDDQIIFCTGLMNDTLEQVLTKANFGPSQYRVVVNKQIVINCSATIQQLALKPQQQINLLNRIQINLHPKMMQYGPDVVNRYSKQVGQQFGLGTQYQIGAGLVLKETEAGLFLVNLEGEYDTNAPFE